jgi:predicted lipoprotein with Yx(FWY)xxD motif
MKRWLTLIVVALMLATSAGMQSHTVAQDATTVLVAENAELGQFFTDPEGRTLYLWTNDVEASSSNCYGPCVSFWPIFTSEEPLTLPDGVDGELTLLQRTDGTTQVAYNGIPLYYFAADQATGDINGQWVGDAWFVVAPGEQFGAAATMVQQQLATPAASSTTTLLIANDPTLGDYFTDAEGRTVYLFTKDTELFTSTCTGDCLTNWPPVPAAAGRLTLPDGGLGELAQIDGGDGNKQLSYSGIPLYYFAGDTAPGQINGQGVGGVWWVVKPGARVGQATPTAG